MSDRASRSLRVIVQMGLALAASSAPAAVFAQAPDAAPAAPTAVTCATVLTQDEASAIVGDAYAGPSVDEPRPGFTRCEWQGEDTNFGFTYANATALADEMTTAAAMWEMDVSAVENDQRKRELLPGIGERAALVPVGDDALLLAVARADGVARMVLYKVDRAKALALARAIAAP
jgi:hypothetical protein